MRKTKTLLSLVIVFALLTAVLALTGTAVGENALFDTGNYYTVQENYTTDKVSDGRAGTLITASASDQSLLFKSPMSGNFEIEFRPISETTGVKQFSTINFFIRSLDSRYGLQLFFSDGDTTGLLKDDAGKDVPDPKYGVRLDLPERVYGWSSETKTAKAGSRNDGEIARMGFDTDTKQVYCYNGAAKSVIVDLDDLQSLSNARFNTNALFKGFSSYEVEITVSGITGQNASFIIYSINGQNMAGGNNAGPVLVGNPKISHAVLGEEYVIDPQNVKTYDFIDGYKDAFVGTITATAPSGNVVTLTDNKFTPNEVGIYKMSFTAVDEQGLAGITKTVDINVLAIKPAPTLATAFPFENITVAKDSIVSFPSATAQSDLDCYNDAIAPILTISKAGQVVTSYSALDYSEYTFTEEGSYEVKISAVDAMGEEVSKNVNVTVSSDAPYFEFLSKVNSLEVIGKTYIVPEVKVAGAYVTSTVEFPDGRKASTTCFNLDALGVHKITYTATTSSNVYELVKYFVVDRSSASLFTSLSASKSEFATAPDYAAEEYKGVKITGSRSMSTARWANIINLKDNTEKDELIKFFVMPEELGVKEYTQFQISLTDANDPTRKFTIRYTEDKWADDYKMDGTVCGNKDGIFTKVGSLRMSPYGANNNKNFGWYPAIYTTLYYDWATNTLYGGLANQNSKTNITTKIVTLDDETVLGTGNGFPGFTTGEVYLDVTFVTLASSSPDMLIMNVDGQDLSTEYVVDNTAPYFCIDYDGNEEDNLPLGVVGHEYPIYKAVARDTVDGLCQAPSVKIYYYEDGLRSRYMTGVSEDSFIPNQTGTYSIEYISVDAHGNEGTMEVMVEVVDTIPPITYEWDDVIPTNAYTGVPITIPGGEPDGGSGILKEVFSVTVDDEPVEVRGRTFTPLKSGDYEIKVVITDYLNNTQPIVEHINISANPNPVLVEATVPSAVVVTYGRDTTKYPNAEDEPASVKYARERGTEFAPWTAYDYSTGEQVVLPVTIKVKKQGAQDSTTITLDDTRVWLPNEIGVYDVMFSATNSNKTTTIVKEVAVVETDKGVGFMSKFFVKKDVEITAPNNSTLLAQVESGKTTGSFDFINPLPADGFNFSFTVRGEENNFESVTLTMIDSVNPNEVLELRLVKEFIPDGTDLTTYKFRESSTVYVNGIEKEILGSFHNINRTPFDINYDNDSFIITDNLGGTVTKVTNFLDGSPWTGFSSGMVYIKFTFNNVNPDPEKISAIVISSICGQSFGGSQSDRTRPTVKVPVAIPAEYGDKLHVPAAFAYDVLSKLVSFTVTVTAPDGTILLDKADATKDYEFDVTQYGNYDIKYLVADSAGTATVERSAPGYIVTIRDKIAPTITVNGEVPASINANSVFTAPTADVADNRIGGSATLWVWWVMPNGQMIKLDDTLKVLADYTKVKGNYKLIYFGIDVDGYTVTKEYTVTVK